MCDGDAEGVWIHDHVMLAMELEQDVSPRTATSAYDHLNLLFLPAHLIDSDNYR